MKRFLIYRLPAVVWAAVLFTLSSIPSQSLPSLVLNFKDLFLHFAAYSVFGLLLAHALIPTAQRLPRKSGWLVILIGCLYGASDEFHQIFVPGRYCTFSDFLADCAGVAFGLFLYWQLFRRLAANGGTGRAWRTFSDKILKLF